TSGNGLADALEGRAERVGDVWLAPQLDGERHDHEGVDQLQQAEGVFGHVVERELVAVGEGILDAGQRRVVELLHLRHRARHARGPPLPLGRQTPLLGERLELREPTRKQRHRLHPFAGLRSYSSTRLRTAWWKFRTSTSWSLSGNRPIARDSRPSCVASRVFASCSEYSLNATAAISRPTRSEAFFAGTE